MTDESNALVGVNVSLESEGSLNSDLSEATEHIERYVLLTKEEAEELIKKGRDAEGFAYSIYTWAAMLYFTAGYLG